eukprot:674801-Pyramimonas_sp.AAC.1
MSPSPIFGGVYGAIEGGVHLGGVAHVQKVGAHTAEDVGGGLVDGDAVESAQLVAEGRGVGGRAEGVG